MCPRRHLRWHVGATTGNHEAKTKASQKVVINYGGGANSTMIDHAIFASYGNDSIALIQWAVEQRLENVTVAHSDTGWGAGRWQARVDRGERWAQSLGFKTHSIASEGMVELVKRKKGWPLPRKFQFCTEHLKIVPAQRWLDEVDPDRETICMVGVRREESRERRLWPEWVEESDKHGLRPLWSPLVNLTEEARNTLVVRAGFEVLPHRSQECFPCINSNRRDLRQLDEERVEQIAKLEVELGHTSKGKPRTMFRPYRHQGATGIREVWRWAKSAHGKYRQLVMLGEGVGCDAGMCGES